MPVTVTVIDTKWRELVAKVAEIGTEVAKVGILQHANDVQGDATMVEIAAAHEFGTAHVPERSFIRRTFAEKQQETAHLAEQLAKAIVLRGMDVKRALGLMGAWGASEVKGTIASGPPIPPPLAPETIARKGSSRPLVDTGQLLASITWEVGEPEP